MTKITQDTELKVGMKVKFNNEELIVDEINCTNELALVNNKGDTVLFGKGLFFNDFIRNNCEIIKENKKVIVSELIARKLEKAKKESIEIECGNFTVHSFAWKFLGKLSNDDISKEELSFKKIVKICEGTTFDKNGWEVEKSKHWEAKEGEIVWFVGVDGIVSNLIVNAFTRQVISVLYESKNHFQTKEEAEAKVELIRSALRGEG